MLEGLHIDGRTLKQADLAELLSEVDRELQPGARLLVHAADQPAFFAALLAGEHANIQIIAAPSYWAKAQLDAASELCQPTATLRTSIDGKPRIERGAAASFSDSPSGAQAPGLVLFTSGTTGTPKGIHHEWQTISASGRFIPERLSGKTWYLAYEPAGFAGLQVFFSAQCSGGSLMAPRAGCSFREHAEAIARGRAEVVSATPTWWRMLIAAWPADLPIPVLEQATLGGEIVDQATLDLVGKHFRPAQLTHIYASSETGTAIVVSDRKTGFPRSYLDDPTRDVQLRRTNGQLEIKSPLRMSGYLNAQSPLTEDGWLRTGDLIELRGERYHFVGREDQRLNIAGSKLRPEEIEEALQRQSEVLDCVVYGKRNPIVGMLLAADIVPVDHSRFDPAAFRRKLSAILPAYKVPRHFRIVEQISVSSSGKKLRPCA